MNRKQIGLWWKVALLVANRLQERPESKDENLSRGTNRIRDSAEKLQRLVRSLEVASSRDWREAQRLSVGDCQNAIRLTEKLLEEMRQALTESARKADVKPKDVFLDLKVIQEEFDELQYDAKNKQLSVVSKSIQLDETLLGRFRIELQLDSLSGSSVGFYEVFAIEPNAADTNESVTHPHVEANRLCEGDAQPTIRLALQQGRLFDFFQIVQQVLGTYNPSSAYVQLSDWTGVQCRDCGFASSLDDSRDCSDCGSGICCECVRECDTCSNQLCGDCHDTCDDCCEVICKNCTETCENCKEIFCNDCMTENERCKSCEEKSKEEADAGTDDVEVHANSVGETAVPA